MGQMTTSEDWKLLNRAHYRALRVIERDFKRERSRGYLNKECKRATSRQWGFYSLASTAASILHNRTPGLLYELIYGNSISD